jgi:hypothetical protein
MSDDLPDDAEYRVGKGRPPRSRQWKPGQSGNPRGRPRGSRSFATIMNEILNKQYQVSERGQIRKISGREVLGRTLFQRGSTGNLKAIASIFAMEPDFLRELQSRERITSNMTAEEAMKFYVRFMSST